MKKFGIILAIVILSAHLSIFLYQLINFNGLPLNTIGIYGDYKYAFKLAPNPAIYRDNLNERGNHYEKIIDRSPGGKTDNFFFDNKLYFTTREYTIIALNLSNLEAIETDFSERNVAIICNDSKYILVKDYDHDSLLVLDINTFEIIKTLDINGKNFEYKEGILKFDDMEYEYNKTRYTYNLDSKELKTFIKNIEQ